jgi:hypothetical protein
MASQGGQTQEAGAGFLEVVGRALTDDQFRELLYTDRAEATKSYTLTQADQDALDRLPRQDLEQQAEVLAHTSDLAISVKISISF